MNTIQRIAKNTVLVIMASIATAVINFLFTMYVARYLGAEGFGVLSFALAITAMFSVIIDIGLNLLATREVARDRTLAGKYLGNIAVMKIILAVIVFGLIALVVNILGYPQSTVNLVYLIALSMIGNAFSTMFYAVFQAYERMEFITIGQVLNSTLLLSGALIAINQGLSIGAFAWIYLLTSAATLVGVSIISVWNFPRPKLEIDLGFWRETFKQAWPFGLVGIFTYIYYWVDSVMLSKMQGAEAVGWYSAAYRLFWALSFISAAYYASVFPVMSRFYVASKGSLRFIYEKSVRYMAIIAIPIGVGTTLLSGRLILAVFGTGFAPSAIALQILIWSLVFTFISGGFAHLFNSLNRQIMVAKVTGICALLNVGLNLVLIPGYSYIGAAIARTVTDLVALALVFVWSMGIGYGISARKSVDAIAKALIASGAMGAFIIYLPELALWWLVPLSALVYFVVLFIIRGLDREDKSLLRQLLNRPRTAAGDKIDKVVESR